MTNIHFDVYVAIARQSDPSAFVNFTRTCKQFYVWRNHPHVLQQFHWVHIDRHIEAGHVALLKYKHKQGRECSYSINSAYAITIALERNYLGLLSYLFSLGKKIEGYYVLHLAARRIELDTLDLIRDHTREPLQLLRAAINQGNHALASRFTPEQIYDVLKTITVDAQTVINKCVAAKSNWDDIYHALDRRLLNNCKNEDYLLAAILRRQESERKVYRP